MIAYRISLREYGNAAFSGLGSAFAAQRWNSRNIPLVYASGSLALATLEVLANLNTYARLAKTEYVYYAIKVAPRYIENLREDDLPNDWKVYPHSKSTQTIGDKWFLEKRSLALVVPSAVVPSEKNILFNPLHQDFKKLVISQPKDLKVDPRLIKMAKD